MRAVPASRRNTFYIFDGPNIMDDYENPVEGKTYISPRLKSFGDEKRNVRIATKQINSPVSYAFAQLDDEVVLRHKADAKTKIQAKFFEDDRKIFVLNIQGYTVATEKPHNASFSFVGDEIRTLLEFVQNIQSVPFESASRISILDEDLRKKVLSSEQAREIYQENKTIFDEVLRAELSMSDVVAVGYRKKQLEIYAKLIGPQHYFEKLLEKRGCKPEALWQKFFEKNPWIFGYGLGYVFLTGIDAGKLERVVQGFDIEKGGKRVDALLKTRGIISNLCFAEIKTHNTELLSHSGPYRSGCWAPSKELSGAISQVQGTVASAVENLSKRISLKDDSGNPTGEEIYNYQPKSFLVIGSLKEFVTDNGINEEKLRSFELFRRNIHSPEIITFDELYERAKFIVGQSEI